MVRRLRRQRCFEAHLKLFWAPRNRTFSTPLANMGRRLSAEEKIAKAEAQEARAAELAAQGRIEQCRKILEAHPDLSGDCLTFLQKALQRKTGGFRTSELNPTPVAKGRDDLTWLEQYTKLEATPSKLLQAILISFDNIVFSSGNLRGYCSRHQREPPRLALAETIEFCTDYSMMKIIPVDFRNFGAMSKVLLALYEQKGRRASRLALPPDWNVAGHFQYDDRRSTGEGVFCRWRVGGAAQVWHRVPRDLRGDLRIDDNFSFRRATIREAAGNEEYLCCGLVAEGANECVTPLGAPVAGVNDERSEAPGPTAPQPPVAPQPMEVAAKPEEPSPGPGPSGGDPENNKKELGSDLGSSAGPGGAQASGGPGGAQKGRKRQTLGSSMLSLAVRLQRARAQQGAKCAEDPPQKDCAAPPPEKRHTGTPVPLAKRRRESITDVNDEASFVPPPCPVLVS